jgi:hypothetical protein
MAEDGVNIFSITDINGDIGNHGLDFVDGQIELVNNGYGFKIYDRDGRELLTENLNGYRISNTTGRTINLRKDQENEIEFELGSNNSGREYVVNQFIARFPAQTGGTAMKKKSKNRRRKNKSKKRRKSKSKKHKKKTRRKRR